MKIIKLIKSIIYERNIVSLMSNLSFAFFGFLSFMILARSMSKADFGAFILFLTASAFVDLFRFGLTRNAVVRFLSGSKDNENLKILGAINQIGLWLVLIIAVIQYGLLLVFREPIEKSGFIYFFYYYPVLALANLPWNNAMSVLQSWQAFGRITLIRTINVGFFTLFLIANIYILKYGVVEIIWANIISNLLASIISTWRGWDGLKYLRHANKETIKKILKFGKFSMATIIGSSLLRSADAFLIGIAPIFGAVGVAIYAIPLKINEILEIPLRSFMATAYPKMSKANMEGDNKHMLNMFYTYGGAITLLFIPLTIVLFIFAEPIILILGGDAYHDSMDIMVLIFRAFTIYGLILPLDRISGVALDSINKPEKNMLKVIVMVTVNVIGDLIAIFYFESLFLVSLATIVFTVLGLIMGYYYLNKEYKMEYHKFFTHGNRFLFDAINSLKSKFLR